MLSRVHVNESGKGECARPQCGIALCVCIERRKGDVGDEAGER